MSRRGRILLSAIGVLAMASVGVAMYELHHPHHTERYEGMTPTEWIVEWSRMAYIGPPDGNPARRALRHFGTNAYPTLIEMLARQDPPWKRKVFRMLDRGSHFRFNIFPDEHWHFPAWHAFALLGPEASNAVPGLIELYGQNLSESSHKQFACSLSVIGPAAAPAIPFLLKEVNSANPLEVRRSAISALGHIHSDPGLVIPALTNCLADASLPIRIQALDALKLYRSEAKAAAPQIMRIYGSASGLHERESAESALKSISQETVNEAPDAK